MGVGDAGAGVAWLGGASKLGARCVLEVPAPSVVPPGLRSVPALVLPLVAELGLPALLGLALPVVLPAGPALGLVPVIEPAPPVVPALVPPVVDAGPCCDPVALPALGKMAG